MLLMLSVVAFGLLWHAERRSALLLLGAVVLLAVAGLCGLAGALALGRNLTPFPQPSTSGRLIQHGIYAVIRHPLYTSVICAALGWALLRASWPALAATLALSVYFDAKARREELALRRRFPAYADYQRRVRRFVPWIY